MFKPYVLGVCFFQLGFCSAFLVAVGCGKDKEADLMAAMQKRWDEKSKQDADRAVAIRERWEKYIEQCIGVRDAQFSEEKRLGSMGLDPQILAEKLRELDEEVKKQRAALKESYDQDVAPLYPKEVKEVKEEDLFPFSDKEKGLRKRQEKQVAALEQKCKKEKEGAELEDVRRKIDKKCDWARREMWMRHDQEIADLRFLQTKPEGEGWYVVHTCLVERREEDCISYIRSWARRPEKKLKNI